MIETRVKRKGFMWVGEIEVSLPETRYMDDDPCCILITQEFKAFSRNKVIQKIKKWVKEEMK